MLIRHRQVSLPAALTIDAQVGSADGRRILPSQCLPLLRQSALVAPSDRVLQTASELLPGVSRALADGPQAAAIVDALIRQWQNGQDS